MNVPTTLPIDLGPNVEAFLAEVKTLAADGLTLAEIGKLLQDAMHLAVLEAEKQVAVTGKQKKQAVLDLLGKVFDVVFPFVDLFPGFSWVRGLVQPYVRAAFLSLASGAIEVIVTRLPDPTK